MSPVRGIGAGRSGRYRLYDWALAPRCRGEPQSACILPKSRRRSAWHAVGDLRRVDRGAAHEAAAGFPVLFDTALPALAAAQARGLAPPLARLDALFHVIAVLDDSNLALRGGLEGLRHAQAAARGFLTAGGGAFCAGENGAGQLGTGTSGEVTQPLRKVLDPA